MSLSQMRGVFVCLNKITATFDFFSRLHSGELKGGDWEGPRGALAQVLLLDQFPRTVYRCAKHASAAESCQKSHGIGIRRHSPARTVARQ